MGIYGTQTAIYGKDANGIQVRIGTEISKVPTWSQKQKGETPKAITPKIIKREKQEATKPVEAKKKPKAKSKKKTKKR